MFGKSVSGVLKLLRLVDVLLVEASLIRRWPIQRGHGCVIEAQINCQLSAMVREVAEHGIRNHHVPRILASHLAAHGEFPGR